MPLQVLLAHADHPTLRINRSLQQTKVKLDMDELRALSYVPLEVMERVRELALSGLSDAERGAELLERAWTDAASAVRRGDPPPESNARCAVLRAMQTTTDANGLASLSSSGGVFGPYNLGGGVELPDAVAGALCTAALIKASRTTSKLRPVACVADVADVVDVADVDVEAKTDVETQDESGDERSLSPTVYLSVVRLQRRTGNAALWCAPWYISQAASKALDFVRKRQPHTQQHGFFFLHVPSLGEDGSPSTQPLSLPMAVRHPAARAIDSTLGSWLEQRAHLDIDRQRLDVCHVGDHSASLAYALLSWNAAVHVEMLESVSQSVRRLAQGWELSVPVRASQCTTPSVFEDIRFRLTAKRDSESLGSAVMRYLHNFRPSGRSATGVELLEEMGFDRGADPTRSLFERVQWLDNNTDAVTGTTALREAHVFVRRLFGGVLGATYGDEVSKSSPDAQVDSSNSGVHPMRFVRARDSFGSTDRSGLPVMDEVKLPDAPVALRQNYVRVYHGTTDDSAHNIVNQGVNLHCCYEVCDFGRAFYVTPSFAYAARMAMRATSAGDAAGRRPVVLAFDVPERELNRGAFRFNGCDDERWHAVVRRHLRSASVALGPELEDALADASVVSGPITHNTQSVQTRNERPQVVRVGREVVQHFALTHPGRARSFGKDYLVFSFVLEHH